MKKRYLFGLVALSACVRGEVVESRRPETPEPVVRVGMQVDTTESRVTANKPFRIAAVDGGVLASADSGEVWTFRAEGQQLRAANERGDAIGPVAGPLRVTTTEDGFFLLGGKYYRGSVLLRVASAGKVTAINVLEIEDYLLGVVQYEIGRLSPNLIEAVKAQAVAARTYAIGNLNRWNARGFDFYPTVLDQVYGGSAGEDSITTRAVLETRGVIVSHDGKPILAYYSSTCGGRTAAVRDVWPWRPDQPYLVSVPDTMGATGKAYCETSSRFRWTVSWARDQLRDVLSETLGALHKNRLFISRPAPEDRIPVERVENVELMGLSAAGRAESVRLKVDGRQYDIRADSIRWVLRPEPARLLNSSMLLDVRTELADGRVERLEVHGGGWGHGIGMCQVGAINRARAGQSYRQILGAYYSGTQIQRLY